SLRFRTEKTFVAVASLSHRKNICCCRFAFAQKKHLLLSLRFRTENIRFTAESRANMMLDTKALSPDVMVLAFVALR
ncbi:hypothetical protein ACIQ7N_03210, partial [Lysinibacillus sp. NPDC095746]|uniref:hypothetical protein n=1 Tax=Lysinibacillus sp. NPDC095746 TaxID=3364134 RepID=UPI00381310AB